jgi:hypothetical protein
MVGPSGAEPLQRCEFAPQQNEVMSPLGRAMRDVGLFLGVFGVLSIAFGFARLFVGAGTREQALTTAVWSLLPGGILLMLGAWTRDAGRHFQRVASTQGADIQHLIQALDELRHAYGLARLVIAAAQILVALTGKTLRSLTTRGRRQPRAMIGSRTCEGRAASW